MELVNLLFSAENVRMLVLLAFGYCCYVMLNSRIKESEQSLLNKMDEKINAFHAQLKANDFAHLNNTIEALTFTLEKNGFLKREDKEYIDGRLDK